MAYSAVYYIKQMGLWSESLQHRRDSANEVKDGVYLFF